MTDKQIEAEALFQACGGSTFCLEWGSLDQDRRNDWLRVAEKARELADARYKPMVGAARVYMETHGQAEREALRRELDNLKGGG